MSQWSASHLQCLQVGLLGLPLLLIEPPLPLVLGDPLELPLDLKLAVEPPLML